MKERLSGSDYRFIAICLALLAATVWFSAGNFYRAFPEASIDFQVNRDDARDIAIRFLAAQTYHVDGYRTAAQFDYDDEAKTFLERELGLERANHLMGSRIRLWRWNYRWFRPLQKEEFRLEITPRGEIAGFEHELAEDAARPAATADQARANAEAFLRDRMSRDPAALDFLEEADVVRPHRIDRTFTWQERGFEIHNATYRYSVTVLGNEPGEYREWLKIPDQWKRDYDRLRSKNELTQQVDTYGMALLMCGLLVIIVLRVRRGDVQWRWASRIGVAGIALGFFSQLNEFPLHEFTYATTDSYGSFVVRLWLNAVLAGLGSGGFLFVLAAGAEPLYREYLPDKMSLGALLSIRGLRTKRFLLGAILGITLTGIFIAYQTAFYMIAFQHGAWSPADVPYTDLLNTRFPWAFVLFGGFFPAVFEEFAFRMFAIPFLRKAARSIVIAVVAAGFLWGFGHSSYPQQPFYIRGIEVGFGGVALGVIMLRFGILPTLIWHYSVDAMYSAMLLMRSHSMYYKLSGAAAAGIMVLPVIVALVAYLRAGGFETEEGLRNVDAAPHPEQPHAAAPHAEPPSVPYTPLPPGARWAALALLVAGVASLALPAPQFDDKPQYKISAEQARAAASGFLLKLGADPGAYQHITYPGLHWNRDDRIAAKYFLQHRPLAAAAALFARYRPVHVWSTRYFKPLDEEEFLVRVHPETAQVLDFNHDIPEDRPGADLSLDQARALAERFATSYGWDVSAMGLKESSSEKKKARRDSNFEWETRPGDPRQVDQTPFRVVLEVSGDQVTAARVYWDTPEVFDRTREASNAVTIIVAVIRIATLAAPLVYALLLLILGTRDGIVRWRAALKLAAPAMVLYAIGRLLMLGLRLKDYDTAKPLETFQVESFLGILTSVITIAIALTVASALIATFYPRALEELRRANRRILGIDAALAACAAGGIGLLWRQFAAAATAHFHAQALPDMSAPDLLVSSAPWLSAVTSAAWSTILAGATLGVIVMMILQAHHRWYVIPCAIAAIVGLVSNQTHTAGELALEYGLALSLAAAAIAFCWFFARRNYLAYALVLWLASLAGSVADLIGTSRAAHAWTLVLVMGVSVVWACAPAMQRDPT